MATSVSACRQLSSIAIIFVCFAVLTSCSSETIAADAIAAEYSQSESVDVKEGVAAQMQAAKTQTIIITGGSCKSHGCDSVLTKEICQVALASAGFKEQTNRELILRSDYPKGCSVHVDGVEWDGDVRFDLGASTGASTHNRIACICSDKSAYDKYKQTAMAKAEMSTKAKRKASKVAAKRAEVAAKKAAEVAKAKAQKSKQNMSKHPSQNPQKPKVEKPKVEKPNPQDQHHEEAWYKQGRKTLQGQRMMDHQRYQAQTKVVYEAVGGANRDIIQRMEKQHQALLREGKSKEMKLKSKIKMAPLSQTLKANIKKRMDIQHREDDAVAKQEWIAKEASEKAKVTQRVVKQQTGPVKHQQHEQVLDHHRPYDRGIDGSSPAASKEFSEKLAISKGKEFATKMEKDSKTSEFVVKARVRILNEVHSKEAVHKKVNGIDFAHNQEMQKYSIKKRADDKESAYKAHVNAHMHPIPTDPWVATPVSSAQALATGLPKKVHRRSVDFAIKAALAIRKSLGNKAKRSTKVQGTKRTNIQAVETPKPAATLQGKLKAAEKKVLTLKVKVEETKLQKLKRKLEQEGLA